MDISEGTIDKVNEDGTVDVVINRDLWRNLKSDVIVAKGDVVKVDNQKKVVVFRV